MQVDNIRVNFLCITCTNYIALIVYIGILSSVTYMSVAHVRIVLVICETKSENEKFVYKNLWLSDECL